MYQKYAGKIKLCNYVWNYRKRWGKLPEVWRVAKMGDTLLVQQSKKEILEKIAQQLNLKIKERSEITDYRARRSPKVKIGKRSYYLLTDSLGVK